MECNVLKIIIFIRSPRMTMWGDSRYSSLSINHLETFMYFICFFRKSVAKIFYITIESSIAISLQMIVVLNVKFIFSARQYYKNQSILAFNKFSKTINSVLAYCNYCSYQFICVRILFLPLGHMILCSADNIHSFLLWIYYYGIQIVFQRVFVSDIFFFRWMVLIITSYTYSKILHDNTERKWVF